MSLFKKAERQQTPLKIGIDGPSGSGKTMGALALATAIANAQGKRVALIDSEQGSASLYSDRFDFDTASLSDTRPETYVRYIDEAASAGYVIVVDSVSHAWQTILDEKTAEEKANPRANGFALWAKYTPRWDALTRTILRSPSDIVCTLRSKQAYEQVESQGRKSIVKLGAQPIVRDGFEYELSLVFSLLMSHRATATKDRTALFGDERLVDLADPKVHAELLAWRMSGVKNARLETLGDVRAKAAALRDMVDGLPPELAQRARKAIEWVEQNSGTATEEALGKALNSLGSLLDMEVAGA